MNRLVGPPKITPFGGQSRRSSARPSRRRTAVVTYSVFAFSNLENFEAVDAGTLGHLALDFVLDLLGFGEWSVLMEESRKRLS